MTRSQGQYISAVFAVHLLQCAEIIDKDRASEIRAQIHAEYPMTEEERYQCIDRIEDCCQHNNVPPVWSELPAPPPAHTQQATNAIQNKRAWLLN